MSPLRIAAVMVGSAAILGACSNINNDIKELTKSGGGNEVRALRNQPLVVPPSFGLRPPRTGSGDSRKSRSTTVRARRTVTGSTTSGGDAAAGTGERSLVRSAAKGVRGAGGFVRKEVDNQTKQQKASEDKFTDKLLKWEKREGASVRKNPLGGKNDPVIKRKGEIF